MGTFFYAYQGYIFAALWILIGLYLCFQGIKTHKVFFLISLLFFFMGAWYLVNEFTQTDLFSNPYVWIFRGVLILFLIIIGVFIYKKRKSILSEIEKNDTNDNKRN